MLVEAAAAAALAEGPLVAVVAAVGDRHARWRKLMDLRVLFATGTGIASGAATFEPAAVVVAWANSIAAAAEGTAAE